MLRGARAPDQAAPMAAFEIVEVALAGEPDVAAGDHLLGDHRPRPRRGLVNLTRRRLSIALFPGHMASDAVASRSRLGAVLSRSNTATKEQFRSASNAGRAERHVRPSAIMPADRSNS
jgi:hypothetical protein